MCFSELENREVKLQFGQTDYAKMLNVNVGYVHMYACLFQHSMCPSQAQWAVVCPLWAHLWVSGQRQKYHLVISALMDYLLHLSVKNAFIWSTSLASTFLLLSN